MAALSNYHAGALLNTSLRSGDRYIGLFLSTPGATNNGVEVAGGGYARKPITFSQPEAVNGKQQVTNDSEIDFGAMTADIGTVSFWGIYDAASGGNLLWFGPFSRSRNILTGDAIIIKPEAIVCNLS